MDSKEYEWRLNQTRLILDDSELNDKEKLLLIGIVNYCEYSNNPCIFTSKDLLKSIIGTKQDSTFYKCLNDLIDKRYLTKETVLGYGYRIYFFGIK